MAQSVSSVSVTLILLRLNDSKMSALYRTLKGKQALSRHPNLAILSSSKGTRHLNGSYPLGRNIKLIRISSAAIWISWLVLAILIIPFRRCQVPPRSASSFDQLQSAPPSPLYRLTTSSPPWTTFDVKIELIWRLTGRSSESLMIFH